MNTLSILQVFALILTLVIRGLLIVEQPQILVEPSRGWARWEMHT